MKNATQRKINTDYQSSVSSQFLFSFPRVPELMQHEIPRKINNLKARQLVEVTFTLGHLTIQSLL